MDAAHSVSSQKVWMTVDTKAQAFRGWTEIICSIAKGTATIGLHSHGLDIAGIVINGISADYVGRRPSLNSIPDAWKKNDLKEEIHKTARLAYLQHRHLLEFESQPNLLMEIPELEENPPQNGKDCEKNCAGMHKIVIQVLFSGETSSGLHFADRYVHSVGGLRSLATWLPRVDLPDKQCSVEIEIAVRPDELAIFSGVLEGHDWSPDKKWKLYKYKVVPTPACNLFLAVGPFDIAPCALPNSASSPAASPSTKNPSPTVTHFSPRGTLQSLESTMKLFPMIFKFFEDVLGTSFPLPSVQNVFLPDLRGPSKISHSCCAFSADYLLPAKEVASRTLESQLQIVRGVAGLWFGVVLMAKGAADAWVMEGLVGWLEGRFLAKLGTNEWSHHLAKQRKAVSSGDDGSWPPLCPRESAMEVAGTEWVGRPHHFRWKSTTVMCMLEKRVGQEVFRRVIERLISRAAHAVESGLSSSSRFLSTHSFLKEVGQSGGVRKEIQAFAERWVYGRGCPTLNAVVKFDNQAYGLDVKLQQQGSKRCRDGMIKAMSMSKDGGIGVVKVNVNEGTTNSEHTIRLGSESVMEERFKVHGRPRKKRRLDAEIVDEESQCPVKWVRVDPGGEWLANVKIDQNETMWSNMLDEAKDVVAESEAIEGLAGIRPSSMGIMNVLRKYLESGAFCRVRMEAALALGQSSCEENGFAAVPFLIRYLRSRCYDAEVNLPKRNYFGDLSEHYVNLSLPFAFSAARDGDGTTPSEVIELMLEVLDHNDNEGNEFDDADWVCAFLEALGAVRVSDKEEIAGIVQRIDRYLERDKLFPSLTGCVTQACLRSWSNLSLHMSSTHRTSLLKLLKKYHEPEHHARIRETARKCTMEVELSLHGPDRAFSNAITCSDPSPSVQWGVWDEAIDFAARLGRQVRGKRGVTWATLDAIYRTMIGNEDEIVRHFAYMLIMSICGEPVTTYRDKEEDALQLPRQDSMLDSQNGDSGLLPAPSSSQSPGVTKSGKLKIKLKLGAFSLKA
ncbi:hypothetical protein BSKO_11070 [Bryopsis sp. KO-2023]|nr:hypothetical protein BSKO_11070 [Bryopsis sp. KO-2023]